MTQEQPPVPGETTTRASIAKEQLWHFARRATGYAILVLDPGGMVLWANPGAVEIFGEPAGSIAAGNFDRFFTAEDIRLGIPEFELTVATSHGVAEDNRWMSRSDGSPFWASGMTTVLRDEAGAVTGFVKILRNRTDEKMRIQTLENRVQALVNSETGMRDAIATMSHELRNPLASMSMATQMLQRLGGDEERLQPALGVLERNTGFSARLLDDLQDASRVSTGKMALVDPEPLILHQVLEAATQTAMAQAGHPRRRVDLLLPPGETIVFEGDRLRLQQVFVNLIGNAIKYTRDDGCIWVKASAQNEWVVVRVEDDGIGIAPDMLEQIFHMFTQADTPMSGAGLGIGLALVKQIVELHGGSVQANSHGVEKGSDLIVRLPTRLPPPANA